MTAAASHTGPQSGWVLDGRYALDAPIGVGGTATVWRATHLRLHQPVAVKFLRDPADPALRERFMHEAQTAAAVRHRHVVEVIDVGVHEGWIYLVMELLTGESLADRIGRGPMELADAAALLGQLLGGLAAVHDAGILHLDLKPENVFLVDDGDGVFPKLVDFGIAASAAAPSDSWSGERGIMGTPEYMSPEHVEGRADLDVRADLYSLGVLFYEMLAAELPFHGRELSELLHAVAAGEHVPLERYRPDLGPHVLSFAERAMAGERLERYESARAMRRALAGAVHQTASSPQRHHTPEGEELRSAAARVDLTSRFQAVPVEPRDSMIRVRHRDTRSHTMAPPVPARRSRRLAWVALALGVPLALGVAGWAMLGELGSSEEAATPGPPAPVAAAMGEPVAEVPGEQAADEQIGDERLEDERLDGEARSTAMEEPAPEAARPSQVRWLLEGVPERARLWVDGERANPRAVEGGLELVLAADGEEHGLRIEAARREPWEGSLHAEHDGVLQVELERRAPRRRARARERAEREAPEPTPARGTGFVRDPGF